MDLFEIGDSHYSPLPYSVSETDVNPVSSKWKALFNIDDVVYFCLVEPGVQVRLGDNGSFGVEIHFGVENPKEVGVEDGLTGESNKFHQYKLMPTIVQIVKDYLDKHPKVKMFRFSGSSDSWKNIERFNDWDSPPNHTRFRMYLQYAMKNLPVDWKLQKIVKPNSQRPYAYFKKIKKNPLQENINRIKQVMGLNENIGEHGIIAYHRSDVDFDSFDMSKTETGFGMNRLGWGMYFSENSDLNPKYGNILYEVKLVLPKGKKWLNDYITYDEVVELLGGVSSDTNEINNLFNEFERQRGKKLTHEIIHYLVTKYFDKNTYGDFGKDFASYLMNHGYVGRRVEFCEKGKDTCLIVFDTSIIHIMDKR